MVSSAPDCLAALNASSGADTASGYAEIATSPITADNAVVYNITVEEEARCIQLYDDQGTTTIAITELEVTGLFGNED